jgi:hypothetical protein
MPGISFTVLSLEQQLVNRCPSCKHVIATGKYIILVQNDVGFYIMGGKELSICPRDGRMEKGFPLLFDSSGEAWDYAYMVDSDDSFGEHTLIDCAVDKVPPQLH